MLRRPALLLLVATPLTLLAQNKAFDAHDLSGFWELTTAGLAKGALNAPSNTRPPMTAEGQQQFRKTKTEFGAASLANGTFKNEKDWNDPVRWCDPMGFPRVLWNPSSKIMRLAKGADEVLQFFGVDRAWRDIWTDGRKLPSGDADSRWYGYSVGRWEGDTFIVNSNNFEDKTWLDQYGSPHSDEMTIEERYRRVDREHLELTLTITDPKMYSAPWKSDKKIFQLVAKPANPEFQDLPEGICAWSESRREVRPQ